MQPGRATWTDERLDDLSVRVDHGFAKLERDIRELGAEMRLGHEALRVEIREGDESLRQEMKVAETALRLEINAGDQALRQEMGTRFADLERTIRRFGATTILMFCAVLVERML
jgi:hypothetical protein